MHIIKWISPGLIAIFLSLFSFAGANEIASAQRKIYTTPDRIKIADDGIFYLNGLDQFQPVQSIAKDDGGIFVLSGPDCIRCWGCGECTVNSVCINPHCHLFGKHCRFPDE